MVHITKPTQHYNITEVNALVLQDLKYSMVIISLLINLTVFVTWLVVAVA